ncbi:hypothetical protein [Georgenia sp. SYP-B2076]|uniref:hypothetical protein n=1 Tax=Georgenia sp. SYP-B2076 TaxID=2495881 RepID=UPI000F8DD532|nr:hypothetical protein [Georgenia sp. SYP-B2076]
MTTITDSYMREMLEKTRPYSVVILSRGPRYDSDDAPAVIWEHGRRNFALRAEGHLAVVCAIRDGSDRCGVGIFTTDAERTAALMADDPGVRAGVFVFEVHPCVGFPGSALPG